MNQIKQPKKAIDFKHCKKIVKIYNLRLWERFSSEIAQFSLRRMAFRLQINWDDMFKFQKRFYGYDSKISTTGSFGINHNIEKKLESLELALYGPGAPLENFTESQIKENILYWQLTKGTKIFNNTYIETQLKKQFKKYTKIDWQDVVNIIMREMEKNTNHNFRNSITFKKPK